MINEPLNEELPRVRCTAALRRRLERIAERSITTNLADHIRYAVERYVATEEAKETASQVSQPA